MNLSSKELRQSEQVTNGEQKADNQQVSPSIANANVRRSFMIETFFGMKDKIIGTTLFDNEVCLVSEDFYFENFMAWSHNLYVERDNNYYFKKVVRRTEINGLC